MVRGQDWLLGRKDAQLGRLVSGGPGCHCGSQGPPQAGASLSQDGGPHESLAGIEDCSPQHVAAETG